jgi:hypothetical protein
MVAGSLALLSASPSFAAVSKSHYAAQANQICASANNEAAAAFAEFISAQDQVKKGKKLDKLRIRLSRKELRIGASELAALRSVAPYPPDQLIVAAWLDVRGDLQRTDERDHKLFKQSISMARRPPTPKTRKAVRNLERKRDRLFTRSESEREADRALALRLGAFECVGAGSGGVS